MDKSRKANLGLPKGIIEPLQVIDEPDFERLVLKKFQDKQKEKWEIIKLIGEKGYQLSRAVALITDTSKSPATGFMISSHLMMTNHHVFPTMNFARNGKACFGFLNDDENPNDDLKPYVEYNINPDRFYFSNKDLDCSIVSVDGNPGNSNFWGHIPFPSNPILNPKKVIIIQHPRGRPAEIVRKNNDVIPNATYGVDEQVLLYEADTDMGSSGSPVFDLDFNLVALHHRGDKLTGKYNRGYLISAIKEDLVKKNIYPFQIYI